jgi:hypothetical protein
MNIQSILSSRRALFAGAAALSLSVLLSACGGGGDGGDAGDEGVLGDSITVTSITGNKDVKVGQSATLKAEAVTTGAIPADQVSFEWKQTAGTTILFTAKQDNYTSTITFVPLATGTAKFEVTAKTQSGKSNSRDQEITITN